MRLEDTGGLRMDSERRIAQPTLLTKTCPQNGLQLREVTSPITRTQGCEQTNGEAPQDRHRKGKGDTLDRGERRHKEDTRMTKERGKNDRRKDKRKTARMAKAGQWKEAGQPMQGQTTHEDRTQPKAQKRTTKSPLNHPDKCAATKSPPYVLPN